MYITPLVIGVTGHRDLVPTEIDVLREKITGLFDDLRRQFPNTPLLMMSALAEGADRLAAHAALDAGIELQAVLPMPIRFYRDDFETPESKAEFDDLCDKAEVLTLPVPFPEQRLDDALGGGREIAYANAGMFISAHCHILLALWDGINESGMGGTAQVIYFQHYDRLPGVADSVPRSSLFLSDNETDLVYHICCSRQQITKESDYDIGPLEARWFTTDPDNPSTAEMPPRYASVFDRTDDFNADVSHYLASNEEPTSEEFTPPETHTQEAAERIGRYFGISDVLANYYQARINLTLGTNYTLAMVAGLAFIIYAEMTDVRLLVVVFLVSLFATIILAGISERRQWHRKYLDYRVLAEGLRVQFYWAVAGVHGKGQSKFEHDNFLRQRDMELGWIRNVMRVAGTLSDSQASTDEREGLRFVIRHWIGDDEYSGQLDYYRTKATQRARDNRRSDRLTMMCLWSGILVAVILVIFLTQIGDKWLQALIVLMGVLPLVAGIAEAYTQRKADRELTKQYQFMALVFANARRRLDEASGDPERREVLRGLGDAALSEHAEWILIQRERQPESAGL